MRRGGVIRRAAVLVCVVGLLCTLCLQFAFPEDKTLRLVWTPTTPSEDWVNYPDRSGSRLRIGGRRDEPTGPPMPRNGCAIQVADGCLVIWAPWLICPPIPLRSTSVLFAVVAGYLAAWPYLCRYRRRKRGLCVKCGYDLTGNTSGKCPECGSEVGEARGGRGAGSPSG